MSGKLTLAQIQELHAFLVDSYKEKELGQELRLAGLLVEKYGLWSENDTTKDKFFDLITKANDRDWGLYLIYVAVGGRSRAGGAQTLAANCLAPHEQAGVQLLKFLDGLDAATVVRCYDAARPQNFPGVPAPSEAEQTRIYVACSIAAAQDTPGSHQPLHAFACELAPLLNDAGRRELDLWWDEIARQLKLSGASPSRKATARGSRGPAALDDADPYYAVMVELLEADGSTPQEPLWWPQAWLYRPSQKQPGPPLLEIGPTEPPRNLQTLSQDLAAICNRVGKEVDLSKVIFEFFVSLESLCLALDQCPLPLAKLAQPPLGWQTPVVIRFRDRDEWLKQNVEQRWQRLAAAASLAEFVAGQAKFSSAVKLSQAGGVVDAVYQEYGAAAELQCLLVQTPLSSYQHLESMACLSAAIAAGLPIILWARHELAMGEFLSQAAQLLSRRPQALPYEVFSLRRDATKPLGRHLTLFFENPSYFLPDKQHYQGARR